MSINGIFRTSVSGMNAQANRLSVVSDNIANSGTNGYKRGSTEFSSLVVSGSGQQYNSGTVNTQVRHQISQQGSIAASSSSTDLAIQGDGFFVVRNAAGGDLYTRAGSFVQRTDATTGITNLVNTGGYKLTGTNLASGAVEEISLPAGQILAPTATATVGMNVQLPSQAEDGATKTVSVVVYDKVGAPQALKVTFEKTGENAWTPTVSGGKADVVGAGVTFTDGIVLDANGDPATIEPLEVELADGTVVSMNYDNLTQYASDFKGQLSADGNAPGSVTEFSVAEDGTLYGVLATGDRVDLYRLNMARFQSPDQLEPQTGNVYSATRDSGNAQFGTAGSDGFGGIIGGAVEQSNVDLATELTDMIESQRSYSANSKVFQTGSEILDVLVNLKR